MKIIVKSIFKRKDDALFSSMNLIDSDTGIKLITAIENGLIVLYPEVELDATEKYCISKTTYASREALDIFEQTYPDYSFKPEIERISREIIEDSN